MSVTLADIERARDVVAPHIHRTPLFSSRSLGERIGAQAWLKAELFQRTGSFKPRGAVNAVASLDAARRARGVVTVSAGNAAQAVAYAGRALGASVTVVMPQTAPQTKIDATRGYGAEIRFAPDVTKLMPIARELEAAGRHFVHPFDDETFIAGNGTLGLELLEDLPDVDLVVVPVGGGGLISGIATAIAAKRPGARIIGVEPEGAPAMRRSLDTGAVVHLDSVNTIADGLAPPFAGEHTLEIIGRLVSDVVLMPDSEIVEGMRFLAGRAKLYAEPSGAAAVGALLSGRVKPRAGERVVAIVSGGNVDLARFVAILAVEEGPREERDARRAGTP